MILSETGKKGAHFHTFFPCHFTASCTAAPGGRDSPAAAGAQDVVPGGFQGFPPFPQPGWGKLFPKPGGKARFCGDSGAKWPRTVEKPVFPQRWNGDNPVEKVENVYFYRRLYGM